MAPCLRCCSSVHEWSGAAQTALNGVFGPSHRQQGGEFAFVLLALANQLNVLPADLNRLLIIVVVLSMVGGDWGWRQPLLHPAPRLLACVQQPAVPACELMALRSAKASSPMFPPIHPQALTPLLTEVGKKFAEALSKPSGDGEAGVHSQ